MADRTPEQIEAEGPTKRRRDHRKPARVRAPMVRFNRAVADELMFLIAEDGLSLWEACTHEGMPGVPAVIKWLNESDLAKEGDPKHGFSLAYERAVEARTHRLEAQLLKEACTPRLAEEQKVTYEWIPAKTEDGKKDPEFPSGWKKVETGTELKTVDAVDRSRLAVDTIKWTMARMMSRGRGTRYGYGTPTAGSVTVNENQDISADGRPIFHINIINSPDAD